MQKFHELHKSLGIFLTYRFDGIVFWSKRASLFESPNYFVAI